MAIPIYDFDMLHNLEGSPTFMTILSVLGAGTFVYYAFHILNWLHLYFLFPSQLPRYKHGKSPYKTWALVTGASDGIGKAFVYELAAQGFNVVLMARNPKKLEAVVADVQKKRPGASFRTLVADGAISRTSSELAAVVSDLVNGDVMSQLPGPLTILVNNIGGNGSLRRELIPFVEMTATDVDVVTDLNVRFGMHMTVALLPRLLQNQPSLVLNTGSIAGLMPIPYLVPYVGSKAYLRYATATIANEMRMLKKDVKFIYFPVGNTSETTVESSEAGFGTSTATEVAKGCLQKVGCDRDYIVPTAMQAFNMAIMDHLPTWAARMALASVVVSQS
jgi:17beta-estradiol 17-dehydrogenase / very-long-chain 3-oxoacyl-CoA reductase